MKHSKKLVTLSVLTTMSGAAIYFLNKTLDTRRRTEKPARLG